MEILAYIGISLLLLFEALIVTYVNSYLLERIKNSIRLKNVISWILFLCFFVFQAGIFSMTMGLYKLV